MNWGILDGVETIKRKLPVREMLWKVAPVAVLMVFRVFTHYQGQYLNRIWFQDLLLLVGWVLGWWLAEADHIFYVLLCAPHEVTGQRVKRELLNKNWSRAWGILKETKDERVKLPIRNVLTGFVMTGVGLWIASSSASLIAAGMCVSLACKLYSEILSDKDYKDWYWPFAREFSKTEHQGLLTAWGVMLVWEWMILLRG